MKIICTPSPEKSAGTEFELSAVGAGDHLEVEDQEH